MRLLKRLALGCGVALGTAGFVAVFLVTWGMLGLELAYRYGLTRVEPLPLPGHPPPLPARVVAALWAEEARCEPEEIPRLYPWNVPHLFRDTRGPLTLASMVSREAQRKAAGGQKMLVWHGKGLVLLVWVTRNFTTDEILATYARPLWPESRRLFGKGLGELDHGELALLFGVMANPHSYDPIRNPAGARKRRNRVLERFVAAGLIPAAALPAAQAAPLPAARD